MNGLAGETAVRDAFRDQSAACDKLGSPFTARICLLLADRLDAGSGIGRLVFGWEGDPAPGADSVPLRLCGALNHLVIAGKDAELARIYPPQGDGSSEETLWQAIAAALVRHEKAIAAFLEFAPQTNEVRRSAILLAGWSWLATHFGMPLAISEVGASAGLNLFAERYRLRTDGFERGRVDSPVVLPVEWRGEIPTQADIVVTDRAGCDLAPIDPADEDQRARLLSYVWPDQRDRVERTRAAIGIATVEGTASPVTRADAADWLERRLTQTFEDTVHVVQHTIAWQYFPQAVKARGEAALANAGARATQSRPLARLNFEADGEEPGAAISLTLWDGAGSTGRTFALGRADYHGRWVDWRNPQVD